MKKWNQQVEKVEGTYSNDHEKRLDELVNACSQVAGTSEFEIVKQISTMWNFGVPALRGLVLCSILQEEDVSEVARLRRGQIIVRPQLITPEVAKTLPLHLCKRLQVVPVNISEGALTVASVKALTRAESEAIENEVPDMTVEFRLASGNAVMAAIDHLEGQITDIKYEDEEDTSASRRRWSEENYVKLAGGPDDVSRVIKGIIHDAVSLEASDIHIDTELEDGEEKVTVRLRILGDLEHYDSLPASKGNAIFARFRHLGITESSIVGAQDGQYDITIPNGGRYDLRLSLVPLRYGNMLTIRMLPQERPTLSTLRAVFPPQHSDIAAVIGEALKSGSGIVLIAGRTGDGKSTTLAAALDHLIVPTQKIITVEDPVETLIPGARQVPITKHVTFAAAVRALLRSDPDVMMVGEIRDLETAQIALEASQTGHMILSTVHAKDSASTTIRLGNMGVDKLQLAEEARMIVSQRLVKVLCPVCSSKGSPVGCEACNNTGFKGRTALAELMPFDTDIRLAVENGLSLLELRELPSYRGFDTHASALLDAKVTTIHEVRKALGALTQL